MDSGGVTWEASLALGLPLVLPSTLLSPVLGVVPLVLRVSPGIHCRSMVVQLASAQAQAWDLSKASLFVLGQTIVMC